MILKYMYGKCILFKINVHNHLSAFSLAHTVPVYASVRPGSLQPADRGEYENKSLERFLWDSIERLLCSTLLSIVPRFRVTYYIQT